ncbi:MAG: MFS transporter [Actinobacteria bacterium]|nr:MFS transporter [Actinomycetota bacterium]
MTTATGTRLLTPAFALVGAAALAQFTALGMLVPTLPLYVEGPLSGGDVSVGLVVGAFSLTALLVRPLAARLAERRGRRVPMLAGAAIFAASVAAYQAVDAVWTIVPLRLATGAGQALFFVAAASAVIDLAPPRRRGEAMSLFSLAPYLGFGIGPLVGETLAREVGFATAWLAAAGVSVGAGLLATRVPETRSEDHHGDGEPVPLVHRGALGPGAVLLTSVWGAAGFFAFVPLYAVTIGLGGSRMVFLAYAAVVLLTRSLGARIPDLLGARRTAGLAMIASSAGLVVAGGWGGGAGLFSGAVVFAVGQGLTFPSLLSLALEGTRPRERSAVVATFTAFLDLGYGLGPLALGAVSSVSSYQVGFLASGLVSALGLLILYWTVRR